MAEGAGTDRRRVIAALARGLRRHPLVMVNALLLLAVALAAWWRLGGAGAEGSPVPADLFMRSIATEDGSLGWSQLCPALQAQLPRDTLDQEAEMQGSIRRQQGLSLRIEHVGDRPRPAGGEIRFYVATVLASDGDVAGQKTYVVKTQASGCVESVA